MKYLALSIVLVGSIAATAALAAPAGAPSGSTGLCNDGSYSSSAEKKGACRGHKGVKEWFESSSSAAPANTAPTVTTTTAAAPGSVTTTRKTSTTAIGNPAAVNAQAGGGPGQVWVNESTKVYHCSGDRWYGKTKRGEYMAEADAKAKGFRPEHGKTCG